MAIKIQGTNVINDSRELVNVPNFPFAVEKPQPVAPPDADTEIGETPTLDGGPYYQIYGKTHEFSRFQVSDDAQFSNIVYDSGEIAATTTHTVPAGNLVESTTYYWRVYYEDEDGNESEYSDTFEFTTTNEFFAFAEEFIGTQTEGGFYAGNVFSDVDGYLKAVIVSDGDGDTERTGAGKKAWRTSNTGLAEAQTLADGKSVMDYIVNNETLSDFPAFEWIQTTLNNANYNGYSDWYLPARDEIELIYRHFKPTTQDNNDGTRPSGAEFGADGATYGTNNSSDPNGSGYTTSDPSQTSIASFQDGGADYFADKPYWPSTEYDASASWFQYFTNGTQLDRVKDVTARVRAVRNVTVETPYNPSNIGMEMNGGFYAGNVRSDVDGNWYALIVSDAGGDAERTGAGTKAWRTSNIALAEAQTLSDGKSVMDHIVNNETLSDFPAFEWVQTTLNDANYEGYNDWYIPARDELELVYRNFKPTTDDNFDGTRTTSGFGGDGETYGTNLFTAPADYDGYATSDPSQTSITNFQDGGADYLTDIPYWSSTESNDSFNWYHDFFNGVQGRLTKDSSLRVRAVRRIQISQ